MCLAVTEPNSGSDVGNLQTTAVLKDGHYIVNGLKKFITGGIKADYYVVAVRTKDEGMKGVSLLLIEKGIEGLSTKRLKTQGWLTSNTALVIFENVKVPAKNLLGKENLGFIQIMENFNHERYAIAVMANRSSRIALTEAIKYARNRKTFNKRLIDNQVIRHKIAECARRIESNHNWIEQITFQMNKKNNNLAGTIALLKVQVTKDNEYVAREASQILGGNSYLRDGIGSTVERIYRDVRVNAIGGGSEEILLDLAMKQSKL